MILRSNLFHDPAIRRRRVKSPVEYAVGTIRALEVIKPTVQADALAEACVRMGQSLLAPPSVAGWDGGTAWVNSTAMLDRTNLVLALLGGRGRRRSAGGSIPLPWRGRHEASTGASRRAAVPPRSARPGRLRAQGPRADRQAATAKNADDDTATRKAVRMILTAPEYQLA